MKFLKLLLITCSIAFLASNADKITTNTSDIKKSCLMFADDKKNSHLNPYYPSSKPRAITREANY